MSSEILGFTMFGVTMLALLLGFPVALTISGCALIFAIIGDYLEIFNLGMLSLYPLRIFGVMKAETLVAVPLFVFMGVMLENQILHYNFWNQWVNYLVSVQEDLGFPL